MPRTAPTKRVDRDHATKYLAKGRALLADARNQAELISEYHPVGIGITIVHCAISFCDALCCGDSEFSIQEARHWLRRLERVAAWAEKRYAAIA